MTDAILFQMSNIYNNSMYSFKYLISQLNVNNNIDTKCKKKIYPFGNSNLSDCLKKSLPKRKRNA